MEVRKIGNVYIAMYRTGLTYATARTFWGAVELALARALERSDADRPKRLTMRSIEKKVPVTCLCHESVVLGSPVAS
jgi:hypothetical protein